MDALVRAHRAPGGGVGLHSVQTLPAVEGWSSFSGWEDRCREFVDRCRGLKQEAQREHAARRKRARRLVEFVLESIS